MQNSEIEPDSADDALELSHLHLMKSVKRNSMFFVRSNNLDRDDRQHRYTLSKNSDGAQGLDEDEHIPSLRYLHLQ